MIEYPCVICQNGDPWSNIICDTCEEKLIRMKDLHDEIRGFICFYNEISGHSSIELGNKIDEETTKICKQIYSIKIKWHEVDGTKELKDD